MSDCDEFKPDRHADVTSGAMPDESLKSGPYSIDAVERWFYPIDRRSLLVIVDTTSHMLLTTMYQS